MLGYANIFADGSPAIISNLRSLSGPLPTAGPAVSRLNLRAFVRPPVPIFPERTPPFVPERNVRLNLPASEKIAREFAVPFTVKPGCRVCAFLHTPVGVTVAALAVGLTVFAVYRFGRG